ncbi:MAG: hypothetical protein ACNI26_08590 [Terasakiella sp.]|uniref:hypothetical protein n=1 Tax=unclassified Terasakiella TaxID=2614952 RepID=UPI003B0086FE
MLITPTLEKFNYPKALIKEFDHWVILLRPKQITFGSMIIASKSDVTSFADLTPEQMSEFPTVSHTFETYFKEKFYAQKFNYLALMMVDPNPHFHALPRYSEDIHFNDQTFTDKQFPVAPQLSEINSCDETQIQELMTFFKETF